MTLTAATRRLTFSLAIVVLAVACQPEADRGAPAPTAPTATEPTPVSVEPTATAATFHWQCGEIGVASTYLDDPERVTLSFSGRQLELPIAVSGSGARYADDTGNEFWTKGDSGTLALAAEAGSENAKRECARSERASPWFQAAGRGISFRAGGGEPGWFVEVDRGESPALRATLDYAERTIEVAQAQALQGGASGYAGTTADGTEVILTITREPCQDGMSGEWFEAGTKLQVGEQAYNGCGAFLFE